MPLWTDHAIWWHVYPLGFTGAPKQAQPRVVHRLRALEPWLDYAVELGCSGIMLGPVFASETHGYDTVDHLRIDPRLGDDADFDALVEQAGERGLRLLLDGVFNHVGRSFEGPRLFKGSQTFEGHEQLVVLDHERPAVQEYVAKVMEHWLDRGAAGWRLDAAYAVPPEFWANVLPGVRARHPESWFVGEMIHGDYAGYIRKSGLDSVTQYELWKAIWSSINDRNLFELAWALERHSGLLETFVPQTFVGNHDVTRLATKLEDPRHLGHALAILFTVGGIPSVYYGDEQAFTGLKEEREGGDDAIRPRFPATPQDLAPYGWPTYRLHQRLIGNRRRHPGLVTSPTTVEHLTNRTAALVTGDVTLLLNLDDQPQEIGGVEVGAHAWHLT